MQRRYQDKGLFDNLLLFRTEIKLLLEAYERNVTIYANKTQKIINKMKPENNHGLKRVFRATGFSMKGLMSAWKNEAAFRQETVLACIMLPIVLLINISTPERILLIMTVLIVLIVELLNSAIEAVVDRIGDEIHPLSGQAKDIASAAVFISLVLCALTWSIIIWPLLF
ncbi:MAG: diacylglycerol kinase (ATP) [Shewanella psychromarinicola]|jgi:diacylglycerol kinase (ATP)